MSENYNQKGGAGQKCKKKLFTPENYKRKTAISTATRKAVAVDDEKPFE